MAMSGKLQFAGGFCLRSFIDTDKLKFVGLQGRKMTTGGNSRRDFIKTSVAGAAGIAIGSRASSYAKILGANDRVESRSSGPAIARAML